MINTITEADVRIIYLMNQVNLIQSEMMELHALLVDKIDRMEG